MTRTAPVCWAVVPAKAPGEGKTRLAGALGERERRTLVRAMLQRVVAAARTCAAIERICLVSSSDHGLGDAVAVLPDAGGGLNRALQSALGELERAAADRIIVVAADLPQLAPADFAMLAAVPPSAIAIAPDRHGSGTNALSLPIEVAAAFRFQFGTDSYALHRAEAERLGYSVETLLSDGLEKDIDEPVDFADAIDCLQEAL